MIKSCLGLGLSSPAPPQCTDTVCVCMNALSHLAPARDKRAECSGFRASSLVCKAAHVPASIPWVCECVLLKRQRTYCAQGRKISPFSRKRNSSFLSILLPLVSTTLPFTRQQLKRPSLLKRKPTWQHSRLCLPQHLAVLTVCAFAPQNRRGMKATRYAG